MQVANILVPTDFSAACRPAVDAAVDLAKKLGASLALVHVWQIPPAVAVGATYPGIDLVTPIEEAARAQLDAEARRLSALVPMVTRDLRCGAPWEEILEVAKLRQADLIVMGTHGRTGLRHALLGSVAEKVVRMSPIPVLSVRAPAAPSSRPAP